MVLLNNNSTYYIKNIKHKIPDNLIFDKSIKMTKQNKLNNLYDSLKYTINFLNKNNINYIAISGTLLGAIRHTGIIPWDDDYDLLIFKEDYDKLKKIINLYNNEDHKIITINPGFKIFYKNIGFGDIFVYDIYKNKYVKSYPYINNKPTFYTYKIFFNWIKYDRNDLLPIKKHQFEDFIINIPNKSNIILKINYPKHNLNYCLHNNYHSFIHKLQIYNLFKFLSICEKYLLKLPLIGDVIYHFVIVIISLFMKYAYIQF